MEQYMFSHSEMLPNLAHSTAIKITPTLISIMICLNIGILSALQKVNTYRICSCGIMTRFTRQLPDIIVSMMVI